MKIILYQNSKHKKFRISQNFYINQKASDGNPTMEF